MKRLIIFLLLFAALKVAGQTTGYLRFDTVRIMKQNGTCELYIINKTKDSLGLLTNVGGGLTRFIKSRASGDTLFVGLDTLVVVTSPENTNLGSTFRWLNETSQGIKTVADSWGIKWDSVSTANSLTAKPDTGTTGLATQFDLTTAVGNQTLQNVTDKKDTLTRAIIYRDPGTNHASHSFLIERVIPSNYNTTYPSYGRASLFNRGFSQFATSGALNPTSGRDNVTFSNFAYNVNVGSGSRLFSDEAGLSEMWETHFEMGGAVPHFEHYMEMTTEAGTQFRPYAWYIAKNTRVATLNNIWTAENVAYLAPSGANDTVLRSQNFNGLTLGSMGNGLISLTNRRQTANTYMVSLSDDGPVFGGTGVNQNRLSTSVGMQIGGYIRNTNTYGGNVVLEQTGITNHLRFLTSTQVNTTRAGIFNQQSTVVDYIGIGINSSFLFGSGDNAKVGGSIFFTSSNSVPNIQFVTKAAATGTDIIAGVFGSNGNFNIGGGAITAPPEELTVDVRSSAATNTVVTNELSRHTTSGTSAAGFGVRKSWILETGAGAERTVATEDLVLVTPTTTLENANRVWSMMTDGAAAAAKMTLTSHGTLKLNQPTWSVNYDAVRLGVNGRISMNKDSAALQSTNGTRHMLVIDTATGIFERMAIPAGGGGGGITSVNGETGPAITVAQGTGITVGTTSNTVTVSINSSYFTQGTFTPTFTSITNVDATSIYGTFHYQRIGNQVTVWGTLSIDPTAANTATGIEISLPIASAMSNHYELVGVATSNGGSVSSTVGAGAAIVGNQTTDRAAMQFLSGSAITANDWCVRFTYEVF